MPRQQSGSEIHCGSSPVSGVEYFFRGLYGVWTIFEEVPACAIMRVSVLYIASVFYHAALSPLGNRRKSHRYVFVRKSFFLQFESSISNLTPVGL